MAGIRRSHNQSMRWPSRTKGEKSMTARSRWGIGGSAIVLVIVAVGFLGATPKRNAVQARWVPSKSATATAAFAPPGRGEGGAESKQVGSGGEGVSAAA